VLISTTLLRCWIHRPRCGAKRASTILLGTSRNALSINNLARLTTDLKPTVSVEWFARLFCVPDLPGSNFVPVMGYFERFCNFLGLSSQMPGLHYLLFICFSSSELMKHPTVDIRNLGNWKGVIKWISATTGIWWNKLHDRDSNMYLPNTSDQR
jgi:hypothetical protein